VVDDSKLSKKLGEHWKVPVEVLPFGRLSTRQRLEELGPVVERLKDGKPWITDSGNYIYDLAAGAIDAPGALEARIGLIPGVVESGLFVNRADVVLVAGASGVRTLTRS
jgi:ribose 5-phosphate isomerase A